jgi:hypothetical protein
MPDGAAQRRPVLKVKLAAAILKCVVVARSTGSRGKRHKKRRAGGLAGNARAREMSKPLLWLLGWLLICQTSGRSLARSLFSLCASFIATVRGSGGRSLRVAAARSEKEPAREEEKLVAHSTY